VDRGGVGAGRDIRDSTIQIQHGLDVKETGQEIEQRIDPLREEVAALRVEFAREKGVDPKVLAPLFDHLGHSGLTLDEMRSRAGEAIEAILSRARQKIEPSNEGADIDAIIGAARARLGNLDTAGARSILATKIAEEEAARRQRLIPLLEEQAAVERLSFDHEAAKATLRQLLALDPERVWSWIELGDLCVTTAALDPAINSFRHSLAIAERLAEAERRATWRRR
jgi:tetratricopeptide (TPR) repeat protein